MNKYKRARTFSWCNLQICNISNISWVNSSLMLLCCKIWTPFKKIIYKVNLVMSKAITDKNVPATTLFLFIAPCYSVWFRGKHKLCSFPQFLSSVTRCWLRRILGRTTECLCLKLALYCACFSCRMSQSKEKTDLTLYTPSSNCKELKRNVGSLAEVRKPLIFTCLHEPVFKIYEYCTSRIECLQICGSRASCRERHKCHVKRERRLR